MIGFKLFKNIIINIIWLIKLKYSIFRPFNIKITGQVFLNFNTKFYIDKNSEVFINGDLNLKSTRVIIESSKIYLKKSTIKNSIIKFQNSYFNSDQNLNILNSKILLKKSYYSANKHHFINSYVINSLNTHLEFGEYFKLEKINNNFNEINFENASIRIGSNNKFECSILCKNGKIETGDNVFINYGTILRINNSLKIGSNVFISYEVIILDNNSHSISPSDRIKEIVNGYPNSTVQTNDLIPASSPVSIGDNCWLGMRSVIMKGVNIGDNSIVSLGSIVTKSVPGLHLAYGNPAIFKKINI